MCCPATSLLMLTATLPPQHAPLTTRHGHEPPQVSPSSLRASSSSACPAGLGSAAWRIPHVLLSAPPPRRPPTDSVLSAPPQPQRSPRSQPGYSAAARSFRPPTYTRQGGVSAASPLCLFPLSCTVDRPGRAESALPEPLHVERDSLRRLRARPDSAASLLSLSPLSLRPPVQLTPTGPVIITALLPCLPPSPCPPCPVLLHPVS